MQDSMRMKIQHTRDNLMQEVSSWQNTNPDGLVRYRTHIYIYEQWNIGDKCVLLLANWQG